MLHRIGRLLLDVSAPEFKQSSALVVVAMVDALIKKESSERDFIQRFECLRRTYSNWIDAAEIHFLIQSKNSLSH